KRLFERASRAVVGAQRLAALVDGLLDASRLTYGQIPLNLEELDLVEATREVMDRFAASAKRVGCELQLQAAAPVPGRWDRPRIEQVLTKLLSNGMKFGPGKPIQVSVEKRSNSVHVEVRDHGVGIAPEIADRIFERFGRAGPVSHYAGL